MRMIRIECPSCGQVFEKTPVLQKVRFNKALGASITYTDECPQCGKVIELEISRDDLFAED